MVRCLLAAVPGGKKGKDKGKGKGKKRRGDQVLAAPQGACLCF